jgi:hypothetical protein
MSYKTVIQRRKDFLRCQNNHIYQECHNWKAKFFTRAVMLLSSQGDRQTSCFYHHRGTDRHHAFIITGGQTDIMLLSSQGDRQTSCFYHHRGTDRHHAFIITGGQTDIPHTQQSADTDFAIRQLAACNNSSCCNNDVTNHHRLHTPVALTIPLNIYSNLFKFHLSVTLPLCSPERIPTKTVMK